MKKKGNTQLLMANQQAMDFREFCQRLIRDKIRSKEDKQKLADALGLSFSAADALAYKGVGSFETFLGALFFLYSIDSNVLQDFLINHRDIVRKSQSTKTSDRIWFELDADMTEEEKTYWVSLIRAAKRLELSLRGKKAPLTLQAAEKK